MEHAAIGNARRLDKNLPISGYHDFCSVANLARARVLWVANVLTGHCAAGFSQTVLVAHPNVEALKIRGDRRRKARAGAEAGLETPETKLVPNQSPRRRCGKPA